MALTESIFAALSGDAGVKTALGVSVAPYPIYPNRTPDGAVVPFISFTQIAGTYDNTQNDLTQFKEALYQFSVYAATHAQARAVRLAIANAFIALDATGLAGGEKFTIETERDLYETAADAHHLILEVRFFCNPLAA